MEQQHLGIIVSSIEHKEKNQIVSVYTQNGYESVYVRNAKDYSKGNYAFSMPYNFVSFIASGKEMKNLKSYEIITSYDYVQNDYLKSLYAYAMLFLLKTPHENKFDKKIFDFVLKIFNKMKEIDPKKLYVIFLAKMTVIFGGKPHFNDCVICGNKMINNFSITNGGFVCAKHHMYDNYYEEGILFKKLYNLDIDLDEIPSFDSEKMILFLSKYYQKLSLANLFNMSKHIL